MDQRYLLEVLTQGPTPWIVAAIWGALWGSFFNVLIVRLPSRESVVKPASHCRSCKAPLSWFDNVPILSYVLLRGRCRKCRARYSPRYLLVEIVVTLIAVAVAKVYVIDGSGEPGLRLARFAIFSLFGGLLVAIAMIDIDTMLIPNAITYPAIPLCVLLSLWAGHVRWYDGAIGALGGYLMIRLFADGYRLLTGRMGMGYGDAKLLAMVGGLLGWQVLLPALFLSSMQGSLLGIPLLVIARRRARKDDDAHAQIRADIHADEPPADLQAEAAPVEHAPVEEAPAEEAPAEEALAEDALDEDAQPSALRYTSIPFGPYIVLAGIELILLRETVMAFFPYLV